MAIVLAACGPEGCLPREKIVVIYRGDSVLDETAAVVREKSQVGFIEKVASGGGVQRVVVRLERAGAVRRNDRFLPRRDERGKVGFLVVPSVGDPLVDGAEIEAGFAPPAPVVRPAEPLPRVPETPVHTESKQPQEALESDLLSIRRNEKKSLAHVPAALQEEIFSIPQRTRGLSPEDTVTFIDDRRRELKLRFDEAIADAHERGDREAIRSLRSLRASTEPILRRMRIQASQSR